MNILNIFECVDTHLDTAPFRFILNGIPPLPGSTMSEKMVYMREHYDWMRRRIMNEAGGQRDLCGGFLVPPCNSEADFGVIFCDGLHYETMCGGASLSLAHTVVSLAMVEVVEPVTTVKFDTPAGLITTHIAVKDGGIQKVTLENIPSFLYAADIEADVPGVGRIVCDVSFGGNFYCLVPVEQLGFEICPENREKLREYGMKILPAVNRVLEIKHPTDPNLNSLTMVLWTQNPKDGEKDYKAQCVYGKGCLDPCPCGAGTSSRLARQYAKGLLGVNEEFIQRNNINRTPKDFIGEVYGTTKVGDFDAVLPRISATNAAVTGFVKLIVTEEDRYKDGFAGDRYG